VFEHSTKGNSKKENFIFLKHNPFFVRSNTTFPSSTTLTTKLWDSTILAQKTSIWIFLCYFPLDWNSLLSQDNFHFSCVLGWPWESAHYQRTHSQTAESWYACSIGRLNALGNDLEWAAIGPLYCKISWPSYFLIPSKFSVDVFQENGEDIDNNFEK
jgi:hypothetical protein